MPILLVLATVFILAAMVNLVQRFMQKQKKKAAAAFAESLGFSFAPEQNPAVPEIPGNYLLFAQGSPHNRRNVMEGLYKGMHLTVYEYTFVKAMDRFDESFVQTVVQITVKSAPLPLIVLCPQDQFNAIGINMPTKEDRETLLETAGIRLLNHPDFRTDYKLIGSNPQQIQKLFDNEVVISALATLEEKPYQGRVCLEGYKQTLLFYPLYTLIELKELRNFMDNCISFTQLFTAVAKE